MDLSVRSTITKYTPKSAGNCYAHKVSHKCSSNYYDFFTIDTFISENRLHFANFFQFDKRFMLLVRHDKHSLKFSLESLLFVGIYKNFKIHTYIILMSVVR